jgi:hypothetical protein
MMKSKDAGRDPVRQGEEQDSRLDKFKYYHSNITTMHSFIPSYKTVTLVYSRPKNKLPGSHMSLTKKG